MDVGLVVVGTRLEADGDRSVFGLDCVVGAAEASEAGEGPGVTIMTSPSRSIDEIIVSIGVDGGTGLGGNPWLMDEADKR